MTHLILKFTDTDAMNEWIENQQELFNLDPDKHVEITTRPLDALDMYHGVKQYVLTRKAGGEE